MAAEAYAVIKEWVESGQSAALMTRPSAEPQAGRPHVHPHPPGQHHRHGRQPWQHAVRRDILIEADRIKAIGSDLGPQRADTVLDGRQRWSCRAW